MSPQPLLPHAGSDKYIALVSGLAVGSQGAQPLALDLLVDYLTGVSGGGQDREVSGRVVRLVIAGGSLGCMDKLAQAPANSVQQSRAIEPIKYGQ